VVGCGFDSFVLPDFPNKQWHHPSNTLHHEPVQTGINPLVLYDDANTFCFTCRSWLYKLLICAGAYAVFKRRWVFVLSN
jgi:hypothetical protein